MSLTASNSYASSGSKRSRDVIVSMTRLQGGPSVVRFPAAAINCSVRCVPRTFAQGESGQGVKLNTHLHKVHKLRMNGSSLLLTLCPFMAWAETPSALPLKHPNFLTSNWYLLYLAVLTTVVP